MSDQSSRNPIGGSQKKGDSPVKDDLNELRSLLLAREHEQLGRLQERLDNPELFAGEISSVLPEAILLRLTEDRRLTTVLTPAVEHILKTSVERDPRILVNALFPVIGPAIRKAIAETFKKMIQSLNQTLERSFSWQGLKWRMEARRTGKSIAEVVILHSLLYQVEQVFLIHRHTGLLLQQVVADSAVSQDADMVSSMLTAIQDFAHDSFKLQSGEVLETLQVGELSVWVEQGPQALLAAVIRGNAPEDLRTTLTESLEFIHLEQGTALEHFEGDTMPLEASRPRLEACLKAQYKTRRRKLSPFFWLVVAALLILLGVSVFFPFRNYLRWKEYLGKLNGAKGIVVTEVAKRDGKYLVYGLLDPLAVDPQVLLQETTLDPEKVIHKWETYQALHPEFILERSKRILDPPSTVSLKMEGNTLVVEGSAPHHWILRTRELVRAIPGIMYLQENDLIDRELVEISSTKEHIEDQVLNFAEGSSELGPNQRAKLETLFGEIQKLKNLVQMVGADLHIHIVGHADRSGTEELNSILSQQRADNIRTLLVSKGISPRNLSAKGVGANEALSDKLTEQNSGFDRRVNFHVVITDVFSGY
jgi:OOP family OmpA-OmpF porin